MFWRAKLDCCTLGSVFDPSLELIVVTKENVAAHAFAEHLVALRLSQEVQQLMGRLVGYYEQRRKGSGTLLDIPVENRNNHMREVVSWQECGHHTTQCLTGSHR